MTTRTLSKPPVHDAVPGGGPPRAWSRDATLAGLLLSLAGVVILLGFITAEALYPEVYTTHTNTVSHLAASEPPASVVLQPSAAIFNFTMGVTGAMILAGAWFAARALGRRAVLVPTALLGLGCVGVGVFPLTHPAPHTLFGLIAFLAGGVAVIVSSRVTAAPFRQLWTLLGAVALAGRDRHGGAVPGVGAGGRARRGRDRALDRLPYRPVAGRLRQLPAGGSGRPVRRMKQGS